ncbi:D-arabinono-1,4-lactone oxidase [Viridibacillus arvi]|uniref:FAD-linked oxidase n=1 Tax=Viridibacillus arvi TaxID=263475 RepID=A0A0M0LKA7_9BACL|nr:D-arabinono-1,4-lactone oxidase [Viridibacillus arvi]KOO51347.1 FAD-linked oxidase [Viridibacillus arvi]
MFSVKDWIDQKEWTNWSGNVVSKPTRSLLPLSTEHLSQIIKKVSENGQTLRVTGAGHSFSPVAMPDDIAVSLHNMRGLINVDQASGEVTLWAGTYLYEIGPLLKEYGLALQNMGDIQDQTIAGAVSTGTHGTGITLGSISNQVIAWGFVDGLGEYHEHKRADDELSNSLHLSLGLLGVLVQVTLQTVPLYSLKCVSTQAILPVALQDWSQMIRENRHLEWFYFPGSEKVQVKMMNMIPIIEQSKSSKVIESVKNQFVENGLFYLMSELCRKQPKRTALVSKISASSVPNGVKTGLSYEIFPTPRHVKFLESEYAIPLEHFEACMEEIHYTLLSHPFRVHFPIECRTAAGEMGYLSPTGGVESAFLAFHMYKGMDEKPYFRWVQHLMTKYNGRPHFGKVNALSAERMLELYPNLPKFLDQRDKYDPNNVFMTAYFKTLFTKVECESLIM